MNTPYETPIDLEMFYHGDEDEAFLKRMSVYATDDTKENRGRRQLRSLENVLREWSLSGTDDEDNTEVADETTCPVEHDTCKQKQELLVKGFDIDPRIAPGFKYTVRYADTGEHLFNGEARGLDTIGRGYGKRLTFQGEHLNRNECYFWSDSNPGGFAFNIVAVTDGDVFSVIDSESQVIGELTVRKVDFPQIEKDTYIENCDIVKEVSVQMACSINYFNGRGILVDIFNTHDVEIVEGVAQLVKQRGSKYASVRVITNVYLAKFGRCSLVADS